MRLHLSLTSKVLIFVSAPLLIQLGLLASLASLQSQAEQALRVSTKSGKISDAINKITNDAFEIFTVYGNEKALDEISFETSRAQEMMERVHEDYNVLRAFTQDQPEITKAITTSEEASNRCMKVLKDIKTSFLKTGGDGRSERKVLWRKLRDEMKGILYNELLTIGDEQKRLSQKAPEVQAQFREKAQSIMLGIGLFDLALGLALALFLTKGITTRLHRVSENTYRLASGMPLHKVMRGSDEIARLDQVFHKMANEIKEASRKERAIVENARDLICTIDTQGRFLAVNQAAEAFFGIEPQDLLGKHFIDLVVGSDTNKALDYLEKLKQSDNYSATPLEIEMRSSSGVTVETLWSAHWSEEENSFFCVIHDMTDRRKAEKLKQEVMAMITHDLRTPLSTINNVLDFFENGTYGTFDAKGRNYVLMAKRNADRMVALINDLLDIEKIKSGMMQLEIDTVSLNRCFSNCQAASLGLAEEMSVKLDFEPTDITVAADEQRLDRVLSNLVANAIKYSPKGGTVKVTATQQRNSVAVRVEDQGPGIPPDMLEAVFERFQQVGGSSKSKGGSGLGLTICKAIVEMHGGKIWVESRGQGSTFIFSLPNQS
jgi:PAS domain S-box-containing protein